MNQDTFNQTTHYQEVVQDRSASFRLMIFDGIAKPTPVNLAGFNKREITFGREAGNDIRLYSSYVSRFHGRIRLINGQYIIEDLNSRNGLIFNGEAIRSRVIEDGDFIRIDDGVETTTTGVLMVFSSQDDAGDWKTFSLVNHMETTIGRDLCCTVVLDHVSVSKIHAKIITKKNTYFLLDNDSTNGIMVNGKKIEGMIQLHEKDVILITNSKLIYGNGKLSYCCFKKGINLSAENVVKIVKKFGKEQKIICNDVSLAINPCELVAIVGGSGTGKSTIMNCISGYNRPTTGIVVVNGVDLYKNYAALKNIIGYVPQQDIIFDKLTIIDMLNYAAQLRLPKDFTSRERLCVVARAIDNVELTVHQDKLIKDLSGGQRKRVSIAIELLSDPNLFFLDEPASGLDPGTERNLMKTLRAMAARGKTVIFVTHSTLNLHLCDKIVFMGEGGQLCFCGSYQEALQFFAQTDIVNVYNLVAENPQFYKAKYLLEQKHRSRSAVSISVAPKYSRRQDMLRQLFVLCRRNLNILLKDKARLLLILLLPPGLALLISLVADGEQFVQYEMTKSLLFSLSCSAFFLGVLNSIQEICKERAILKREYMTGLRLDSYISSKLFVMGLICGIQSLLLVAVFTRLIGVPDGGIIFASFYELLLTTFLTALAASAIGLFVSALVKNADKAMAVAPILLIPQLLFSGLIFELSGATEIFSWLAVCRFSMQGYGTSANLNSLSTRLEQQGVYLAREIDSFFTFSQSNFVLSLLVLCLFVLVFAVLASFVLRVIKKEQS